MKELTKPISEVRQKLPALARAAQERMARVVITQQGRPQAVLLGYEDFLGMKTAVELLRRPGLAAGMEEASAELERGEGVPLEGVTEAVRNHSAEAGKQQGTAVELKARALLNKGNALTRLGKADEAIASYDEVLSLFKR